MEISDNKIRSILEDIKTFNIQNYAVLLDEMDQAALVPNIPGVDIYGVYTFNFHLAGGNIGGFEIKLLPKEPTPPGCDGWLLATNSKVCYALTKYLLTNDKEDQVILRLVDEGIAPIYSYVDFFKGETNSRLYLTNIFERAYGIHLPLDIRFLLKDLNGNLIQAGQKIILPYHTITFDSREMDIPLESFMGYLEIYSNIRPLNSKISYPFYHMYIDYFSRNSIATLHQSGLKPGKAGIAFFRGFFPENKEHRLVVSAFNKFNQEDIHPVAKLEYEENEVQKSVERDMDRIPREHMIFQDMNELFADVLSGDTQYNKLTITADRDMHRPNYYVGPKDEKMSWIDVEHGAPCRKIKDGFISDEERLKFEKYNTYPWHNDFPILPKQYDIDTIIMYLGESPVPFNEFCFLFFDENGKKVFEKEEHCSDYTIINLTEYMSRHDIVLDSGLLSIIPPTRLNKVARKANFKMACSHQKNPYLTTNVAGGNLRNVAFDYKNSNLWKHIKLPVVHSEQFTRIVDSVDFETILSIMNSSSDKDYSRTAEVELDIYTWDGKLHRFEIEILPNTSKTISVSELIRERGIKSLKDYYSLWFKCRLNYLRGYHLLHRKSDNAIGIEHFYYSRFNTNELECPPKTVPLLARV